MIDPIEDIAAADGRLAIILTAGLADRSLGAILLAALDGGQTPTRFFHRRALAVASGLIRPEFGEALDHLRWVRNRIVHHQTDANALWAEPLAERVGRLCEIMGEPGDAEGLTRALVAVADEVSPPERSPVGVPHAPGGQPAYRA
jgi:hypothetical protein